MGWLVLVLLSLTTFRLTRLIIKDTFPPVAVPRDKIVSWFHPDDDWKIEWLAKRDLAGKPFLDPPTGHLGAVGRSLAYLLTCPWCMSTWVGGGLVWATTHWVSVPLPFLVWGAVIGISGLLSILDKD